MMLMHRHWSHKSMLIIHVNHQILDYLMLMAVNQQWHWRLRYYVMVLGNHLYDRYSDVTFKTKFNSKQCEREIQIVTVVQ
jgi:hypothetical protein